MSDYDYAPSVIDDSRLRIIIVPDPDGHGPLVSERTSADCAQAERHTRPHFHSTHIYSYLCSDESDGMMMVTSDSCDAVTIRRGDSS